MHYTVKQTVVNYNIIMLLTLAPHLPSFRRPFNVQHMFKVEIRFDSYILLCLIQRWKIFYVRPIFKKFFSEKSCLGMKNFVKGLLKNPISS